MIETILLGFIVAKCKKLKLLPIFKHWSIYPVMFMALIYIYLEYTIWQGDYSLIRYSNVFKTVYLSCFLVLAVHYDRMKVFFQGMAFVWLGTALNMIAIRANGGKMPVYPTLTYFTGYVKPDTFINTSNYGDFHILGDAYTKLIPFCDIWDTGFMVFSIGDLFSRTLVFLIIYHSIKASNKFYITNEI